MKQEKQNTIYPPAVVRALEILNFLAENMSPLSLKEISEAMKIPHASTYRIVKCLESYGYIRESPNQSDKYKLGFRPAFMAKMAFDGVDLITVAVPYIKDLAYETCQACQLCALNDSYIITLDQSLPVEAITIIAKLGESIPINVSASGKILVALLPPNKRRELLEKGWFTYRKNTEHTIIVLERFLAHLEEVSLNMYGTDFEEFSIGIGCLAVPIFDHMDNPIAAIGLTGPIENYRNKLKFDQMLRALNEASDGISKQLYSTRK